MEPVQAVDTVEVLPADGLVHAAGRQDERPADVAERQHREKRPPAAGYRPLHRRDRGNGVQRV